MKFRRIDDIYDLVPPVVFGGVANRDLPPEERMVIRVRGTTAAEVEELARQEALDQMRYEPSRRLEEQSRRVDELLRRKVVEVVGYEIPDREVRTYDDLREVAPPELVSWLAGVVVSGERLSASDAAVLDERKN